MIRRLADVLVFDVLGLEAGTRWGEALHFFFYDSMKIFLLFFLPIVPFFTFFDSLSHPASLSVERF